MPYDLDDANPADDGIVSQFPANERANRLAIETALNEILATLLPVGSTLPYAGTSEPEGWLFANGQAVSRTTYSDLFDAIGTTYGEGDGSTTFNVPDIRGRAVFGRDNMGGAGTTSRITNAVSGITGTTLGAAGGDQRMQQHLHGNGSLTAASAGNHTHSLGVSDLDVDTIGVTRQGDIDTNVVEHVDDIGGNSGSGGAHGHTITGSTANTGSGDSENMPPALILNYIIRT